VLSVHHGKQILKPWLEEHKNEIEVFYLPSYSPELNPDEYFNGTLKRTLENKGNLDSKEKLDAAVLSAVEKIQANDELVAGLFYAKEVLYAAS
jgi:transposase